MKISVLGYSGSGKSTLSDRLGALTGSPVLHLDSVNFDPGWAERPAERSLPDVERFLAGSGWVIDGNYKKLAFERRMAYSDLIILLDYPRGVCLARALRRYILYRGTTRPDMAPGCAEKFDLEFLFWILRDGRTKRVRAVYRDLERKYGAKFARCRSDREVETTIKKLTEAMN